MWIDTKNRGRRNQNINLFSVNTEAIFLSFTLGEISDFASETRKSKLSTEVDPASKNLRTAGITMFYSEYQPFLDLHLDVAFDWLIFTSFGLIVFPECSNTLIKNQ